MAGMPWVRVSADLDSHPKILALRDLLDGDPFAWTYPVAVWRWCARYAPEGKGTGRLSGPGILERAAGWSGARGRLFASLLQVGLLEELPGGQGWAVHDWEEHAGAHRDKFERDRIRMRAKREAERQAASLGLLPDDPSLQVEPTSSGLDSAPPPPGRAWPRRLP